MDDLADFYPELLVAAVLLAAALALASALRHLHLPGPAAFLAVGVIAGIAGLDVTEKLSPLELEEIGVLALYGILFQGGLATGFAAWRRCARPIVLLGLPGTAATAGGLAAFGHFGLGFEWPLALLVGVALAPTDPAAVYATLRGGATRSRARTILEGESGFNDPVGISLMVVAVAALGPEGASFGEGTVRLVEELGIGLAGGVAGAGAMILLLRATPKLEEGFQAFAVLVGAVIVGAGTASLHGSGFLAVYVAGLLLSDRWAAQDGRHHAVPESVAAAAEPILFGLLGAAFAPLVGTIDIWQGVVITLATVFLVRPLVATGCLLGSGLGRPERLLVSWGGLKGAVPLLLAAYPGLEALPETARTEALVLVATAASIVVQGATLRRVARRIPARAGSPTPGAA
ncbi:MAG: cation:proton antiporter [Gaiellales bacterium]